MPDRKINDIKTVVVFDTETTGTEYEKDEIIELGAIKLLNSNGVFEKTDEMNVLIKLAPGEKLPQKIIEITGITDEALEADGIDREEAAFKTAGFFEGDDKLIIAYNAHFDLSFLWHFLSRYGRCPERKFGLGDVLQGALFLDALTVYKDRKPYPHRLFNAIDAYKIDARNSHRASDDAFAAWEVFLKMREEEDDLDRYINLFGFNPKYGVTGRRIHSVTYLPQQFDSKEKLYETALCESGKKGGIICPNR